ncbi:MAG: Eco57I restriction-modification methylase domain-containing protein [Candidatus Helarchaeota archaeon]|nr:Eco57I restriction-modification methylase domain-containing protein [Candidatus Helarchaeota archaeon]
MFEIDGPTTEAPFRTQGQPPLTTHYGLDRCQIDTPDEIVSGFWRLVKRHRNRIGQVIDLGAGDGRFALGAPHELYNGFEIDNERPLRPGLPKNATVAYQCVFEVSRNDYDVCVGNPPYVRHHDIEGEWRERLVRRIKTEMGISINRLCNLFVYFICVAISKTKPNGLIALLVPYEWVSRPSTKPLRDLISSKKWDVHVYRFKEEVFKGVLTTASISIIDKAGSSGRWKFYDIDSEFNVRPKRQMSGSKYAVIKYERRSTVWAMRGLSTGSQKIFTLTETERLKFGLWKSDVRPCVTSLRNVPKTLRRLTAAAFAKHFVFAARRCWLIRSDRPLNKRLKKYLRGIPPSDRKNYTCTNRRAWYSFKAHPVPRILYGSGFILYGPKILINDIGAIAIGSVHGIHSDRRFDAQKLRTRLLQIDFEKRVVAHAGSLRKIEIGQMNSILKILFHRTYNHGANGRENTLQTGGA